MTQDGRNSRPAAWKAFQANYDYVFSLSARLCSYCLSEQDVAALLAMTEYLKWDTRWVSTGPIDKDQILAFADNLEYRLMSGCCDDNLPIQYRYSPEGVLERSLNAGGTWSAAPEYDPRVYSPQFPPMSGDDGADKKCIAATGAAALIKAEVGDQITTDMTRYTLAQLITDWVKTYLDSSNPFLALLTVIANQIFALVLSALVPALTDTVYHIFQCILYCNMANDATFNDSQWTQVRSDITDQIGGIAGIFLEHLVYLLGTTGLSNLVRAGGAASGDCSDCTACQSCADKFVLYLGIGTSVVRGDGWMQITSVVSGETGGYQTVGITTNNPDSCCYISHTEVNGVAGSTLCAWRYCGQPIPAPGEGFGNSSGTIPCNQNFNTVLMYLPGGVFTIKIYFSEESC